MEFPRFCLINPHEFLHPFYNSHYYRSQQTSIKDSSSKVYNEKDQFRIVIDVQDYQPDDISVKVNDKQLIIEGSHDERQDGYGYVTRQFKRRYVLPNDCSPDTVTSTLSSDGILIVVADKKSIQRSEKLVPIRLSGLRTEHIEKRTLSGITQKDIDDTIKEAKELVNRSMVKDDHSRLLKSNMSEIVAANAVDIVSQSEEMQKKASNGHGSTSKKVEECDNSSKLEKSEAIEQFGHASTASGSASSSKSVTQECYRETKSSSQSLSMSMRASDKDQLLSDIVCSEITKTENKKQ